MEAWSERAMRPFLPELCGVEGCFFEVPDHSSPPSNPFWRQASKTVTATLLERLRLRWPLRMGRRRRWAAGNCSRTSAGRPLVSAPKTSQSPG